MPGRRDRGSSAPGFAFRQGRYVDEDEDVDYGEARDGDCHDLDHWLQGVVEGHVFDLTCQGFNERAAVLQIEAAYDAAMEALYHDDTAVRYATGLGGTFPKPTPPGSPAAQSDPAASLYAGLTSQKLLREAEFWSRFDAEGASLHAPIAHRVRRTLHEAIVRATDGATPKRGRKPEDDG